MKKLFASCCLLILSANPLLASEGWIYDIQILSLQPVQGTIPGPNGELRFSTSSGQIYFMTPSASEIAEARSQIEAHISNHSFVDVYVLEGNIVDGAQKIDALSPSTY